ncbi:sarcosine oxidase subunit gamma [Sulfitobacter sp. PS-8MA]|uniref:sarcosine oxidase subunit gamma n=1 Tax=Sulfitobacter sp. PS-8MA TaxID=3237707 RepID=UPI0034C6518F
MNAPVNSFDAVSVTPLPPVARFNLRIDPKDRAAAASAFGLSLPAKIGEGAQQGDRAAYCLGPDEWLLHAAESDQQAIVAAFDALRPATPHSLVVISDRELSLSIKGPAAAELLSVGCPIDLSRLPIGGAKRSVFDYAQVVLIRDAEEAFRLEVWRSYMPHVQGILEIAMREFAAGH